MTKDKKHRENENGFEVVESRITDISVIKTERYMRAFSNLVLGKGTEEDRRIQDAHMEEVRQFREFTNSPEGKRLLREIFDGDDQESDEIYKVIDGGPKMPATQP